MNSESHDQTNRFASRERETVKVTLNANNKNYRKDVIEKGKPIIHHFYIVEMGYKAASIYLEDIENNPF